VFAGDIHEPNCMLSAMKGYDAVLHLAALIAISYWYYSLDTYTFTNIKSN
jgi:dTDP-glucose 4,6-dehydratase